MIEKSFGKNRYFERIVIAQTKPVCRMSILRRITTAWVIAAINGTQISIGTAENPTNSFVCGAGFIVAFVQDGDPTIYL